MALYTHFRLAVPHDLFSSGERGGGGLGGGVATNNFSTWKQHICLFFRIHGPALKHTQSPIQWVLSRAGKATRAWNWPLTFKNKWSYISACTPPYAITAWAGETLFSFLSLSCVLQVPSISLISKVVRKFCAKMHNCLFILQRFLVRISVEQA
jgi:hypothetical protein